MANDEKLSYFVFDNLRCGQDREGGNVYRFNTLEDAVHCYNNQPKEWTTALGGSRSDLSELDLIQRRQGVSVLVTDFNNFPEWRGDPQVQMAIGTLVNRLDVGLVSDYSILKSPILIPLEGRLPQENRYLSDKTLLLRDANQANSAINEAFILGAGWVDTAELSSLSRSFGYHNPNCPTVTVFNVEYRSADGRVGQMDITPAEYGFLLEKTLGKGLERQEQAAFAEHGAVNHLMERVQEWKEAVAISEQREETVEELAKKAKERAATKNLSRPEKHIEKSMDREL